MGHLDVVEAKPEDWSVDPFKLTEQDGWFYGRGTIDMKDGDAALAESLIRLKRERFVPDRDIIVAFTADEEAGGDANGPAFLLKEHRDLIDAALAINLDGGGGNLEERRARCIFEVGTSEKTYVTYTLETTSPGGHGSLPGPGQCHLSPGGRPACRLRDLQVSGDAHRDHPRQFREHGDARARPDSADMRRWRRRRPDLGRRRAPEPATCDSTRSCAPPAWPR